MERKTIKDYLRFSKKERLALFIVIVIVVLIFIYPFLLNNTEEQPPVIIKSDGREISNEQKNDNYKENNEDDNDQYSSYAKPRYESQPSFGESPHGMLFYFDPNTASVQELQNLGLRGRTIQTIRNYLNKGGSFKIKADLKKIYGLHEDEYARLEPYIRIASKQTKGPYLNPYETFQDQKQLFSRGFYNTKELTIADINTADAEAFIALPGIGNSYANRIISFRDKLGGFYSVDQVAETYGLPDSTFQLIRPMLKLNSAVRKMNINAATKDELKAHPYIRWNIANSIVEYRNQHGAYKSLDGLKQIVLIDEATFIKIAPYLSVN